MGLSGPKKGDELAVSSECLSDEAEVNSVAEIADAAYRTLVLALKRCQVRRVIST
jgi:hypothetical protein